MSTSKFERFKGADHQFYFRLKAGNGEIILRSEGYTTRQACGNGISSVKDNAPYDERYEKKETSTGHYFNLKAGNGQVIGSSQIYVTAAARNQGITSVMENAPKAETVDIE